MYASVSVLIGAFAIGDTETLMTEGPGIITGVCLFFAVFSIARLALRKP